jgi:5'-3' exonuclease
MDYAILRGDPSDGLPGVAGIGEKTASDLLRKYGSLDGILAAKDLSPTIRAKLHRDADYLVGARRVVAMAEDCPVVGGDGHLPTVPRDPAGLKEIADRLGLEAAVERVLSALRLASTAA